MTPRELRTPGVLVLVESEAAGVARHDVGMVAHLDGEPVVIGEMFAVGTRPDGSTVALPARSNARYTAACWNGCEAASLVVDEVEAGVIAAAILGAGGGR